MAVGPNYKKRSMAELEKKAMIAIGKRWKNQPIRCGTIGDEIFGDELGGGALVGSAPFARIAGKVMRSLEKKGLAMARSTDDGWFGWCLTTMGLEQLRMESDVID